MDGLGYTESRGNKSPFNCYLHMSLGFGRREGISLGITANWFPRPRGLEKWFKSSGSSFIKNKALWLGDFYELI